MTMLLLFLGIVAAALALPLTDKTAVIPTSQYGLRIYGLPDPEAGKRLENLDVTQTNPEEVGPYLEGDMLIPGPTPKNGIVGDAYRWPGGRIPYYIDPKFNDNSKELIHNAFDAYHQHTCIRFEPKTAKDYNYISIEKGTTGCWSSVGMTGRGKQVVNLQEPGCTTLPGTSIHELMHAVGFMHEQNRDDREGYIHINYENIRSGMEGNFDKIPGLDAKGVNYDYSSVMHYGLTSFSKNGRPTMTALKHTAAQIGQRRQMSPMDMKKINAMYNCGDGVGANGGGGSAGSGGGVFSNIYQFIENIMKQDREEHLNGE